MYKCRLLINNCTIVDFLINKCKYRLIEINVENIQNVLQHIQDVLQNIQHVLQNVLENILVYLKKYLVFESFYKDLYF